MSLFIVITVTNHKKQPRFISTHTSQRAGFHAPDPNVHYTDLWWLLEFYISLHERHSSFYVNIPTIIDWRNVNIRLRTQSDSSQCSSQCFRIWLIIAQLTKKLLIFILLDAELNEGVFLFLFPNTKTTVTHHNMLLLCCLLHFVVVMAGAFTR